MNRKTVEVTAEVDARVSAAAGAVFDKFGISPSQAVEIFFSVVAADGWEPPAPEAPSRRAPATMITTWGSYDC